MPPRRSNPAKRAAEDPIDEVDETKRARPSDWCASAAGMRPAAAASSSRPSEAVAMAGAFAFSQCSRNSMSTVHAVAADDDDGDSQPPPASCMHPDCPYGDEERKEEGGAGRVLRSLSCPAQHTYCSGCLEQMMKHQQDDQGRLSVTPAHAQAVATCTGRVSFPVRVAMLINLTCSVCACRFLLQSLIRVLSRVPRLRAPTASGGGVQRGRCV